MSDLRTRIAVLMGADLTAPWTDSPPPRPTVFLTHREASRARIVAVVGFIALMGLLWTLHHFHLGV